jgi:23S rRNA pseudouridine1911/1915/1917 synthase
VSKISDQNIIYSDNHLIAVNKTSGQLSQGDKTGDVSLIELMKDYIKWKFNKAGNVFLGSVHRLDRPTSGVLIFTRTSKATSRMNELFKSRKIYKTYFAITDRTCTESGGVLTHYLVKNSKTNIVKAYPTEKKDSKKAELRFELISQIEGRSLIKIWPKTGRSHQIRVQLASIGLPIIGDIKYGSKQAFGQAIGLHCFSMKFVHPVQKEEITIKAQAPNTPLWNKFKTYIN